MKAKIIWFIAFLGLVVLSQSPNAWANSPQSPNRQTVPTRIRQTPSPLASPPQSVPTQPGGSSSASSPAGTVDVPTSPTGTRPSLTVTATTSATVTLQSPPPASPTRTLTQNPIAALPTLTETPTPVESPSAASSTASGGYGDLPLLLCCGEILVVFGLLILFLRRRRGSPQTTH